MEQYNRSNHVEISILNEVSDQNLEETVTGICKDSGTDLNTLDIEGCHRLLLGTNATNSTERVTVKFGNKKHPKGMFQSKKDINKKSKVFVSHSLCP